jgi:uncharacterized protein
MTAAGWGAGEDRFQSIDAVRGFAVLGILLMNIVGMGLPAFAYLDPTYAGGAHGADLWTWAVNHVLTDGKMRGLFTMLFGASTVLIASRAEGKTPGPIQTHYLRMVWLLVIGMVHAYFLWWGDILVCYAVAGLFVFPFRKLPAWLLMVLGAAILGAVVAHNLYDLGKLQALSAAAHAPGASAAAVKAWNDASFFLNPPHELGLDQIRRFRGDFLQNLSARSQMAMIIQIGVEPTDGFPEAIGQMLIGMGLFVTGFFTLKWSSRAYWLMMAVGYLIAAPVTAWLTYLIWKSGFDPLIRTRMEDWGAIARPFVALAHGSAVMLVVRSGTLKGFMDRFAAAGRMAFSNYLMSSIITMVLFTGIGFGLYGSLSRFQELYVVAGVWAFILIWSKPWLARFHFGPFEWLWRSLVRMKPQPFLRRA